MPHKTSLPSSLHPPISGGQESQAGETLSETLSETLLLGGKLRFVQSESFRTSLDPIFLAAFAYSFGLPPAKKHASRQKIAELGIGSGAVMLCYYFYHHYFNGAQNQGEENPHGQESQYPFHYDGFDKIQDYPTLIEQSLRLNSFTQNLIEGQDYQLHQTHLQAIKARADYDMVVMNPPFFSFNPDSGSPRSDARNDALYEQETPLTLWLDVAGKLLRPKGRLVMIHQAGRIHEIITAIAPKFGEMILYPLHSKAGQAAKRILLVAKLGSKAETQILQGLQIHHENGDYTAIAQAILHGQEILPLKTSSNNFTMLMVVFLLPYRLINR